MSIPVIDLFAGPGGLSEGFSQVGEDKGKPAFHVAASIEMDSDACATLLLRGAYRGLLRDGHSLEGYYSALRGEVSLLELSGQRIFARALKFAKDHVYQLELGPAQRKQARDLIEKALGKSKRSRNDKKWVLIGGPPCQAYSLAGRSRRANDKSFEDDHKHFLYREYLDIISAFSPPIFVMENVKGLLSSTHGGQEMFTRILRDLQEPKRGLRYEIHSLTVRNSDEYSPSDFVIRAEEFGVPQRRHRVLLLGLRADLAAAQTVLPTLSRRPLTTVGDAIGDMPPLRSGISRDDALEDWLLLRSRAAAKYPREVTGRHKRMRLNRGGHFVPQTVAPRESELNHYLADPNLGGFSQHETRSHMPEDLVRYWYAARTAEISGVSPTLRDFPRALLPDHANAKSKTRPFEDRFRVQVTDKPATTVVSHIAKDGHYYIHPDPLQMRSLTVREAARLQTFPDNYFFTGNRTSQYHQVGNAVPPLLARSIGEIVQQILTP